MSVPKSGTVILRRKTESNFEPEKRTARADAPSRASLLEGHQKLLSSRQPLDTLTARLVHQATVLGNQRLEAVDRVVEFFGRESRSGYGHALEPLQVVLRPNACENKLVEVSDALTLGMAKRVRVN